MRCGWNGQVQNRSYRQSGGLLAVLGGVMIALGLLLLFLCIPGWFWAALAGAGLIVIGFLLIMAGNGRR